MSCFQYVTVCYSSPGARASSRSCHIWPVSNSNGSHTICCCAQKEGPGKAFVARRMYALSKVAPPHQLPPLSPPLLPTTTTVNGTISSRQTTSLNSSTDRKANSIDDRAAKRVIKIFGPSCFHCSSPGLCCNDSDDFRYTSDRQYR